MTRLIGITLVALAMVGACGSESPESMPFEAYCTGEGCSHSGVALASECVEAGHTWGALTTPEACEAAGHQWIDDPNEVDATTEVDDAPDVSACECEPEEHCSAEGECVSDVCVQGASTCASTSEIKHCDAEGASFSLEACEEDARCEVGVCVPLVCEPGQTACNAGHKVSCNSLGTQWVPVPCAETEVCRDGECVFVQPNILLLVDTSFSMNRLIGTADETPVDCMEEEGCPPWTYPTCDDPESPQTRLGVVKKILQELVQTGSESGLRLALQRFPQRPASPRTCFTGHYTALETMTQDSGAHNTVGEDWFQIYLSDVIAVPFHTEGGSGSEDILRWVDFAEVSEEVGADCDDDSGCVDGFCWLGGCERHTNDELRGSNSNTPLGRSLFYAGEYLRRFVLVEGAPCVVDADCASPHHACVEGLCHDDLGKCRSTRVIVFTDGVESDNYTLDDFYHPRIQAKRLHYGLGCQALDECVGGASCEGGVCRAPEGIIDPQQKVCSVSELTCESDSDCLAFSCGSGVQCQGECGLAEVTYIDGEGGDRLTDAGGTPVSVQVHIVDASGIEGANEIIASYGGGEHVPIDLGAAATIVSSVLPLLDAKVSLDGEVCDLLAP